MKRGSVNVVLVLLLLLLLVWWCWAAEEFGRERSASVVAAPPFALPSDSMSIRVGPPPASFS